MLAWQQIGSNEWSKNAASEVSLGCTESCRVPAAPPGPNGRVTMDLAKLGGVLAAEHCSEIKREIQI